MSYPTTRNTYFEDVPIAENIYLMEDPHRDPYMPKEVTTKELKGYFIYSTASLSFNNLLSDLFLPLLLDQWLMKSGINVVNKKICNDVTDCAFKLGDSYVNSTLFTMIFSFVILILQIFFSLWLGALADYGFYRKFMLIFLGCLVSTLSILILTIVDINKLFYFGIVLIALSKIFYSAIAVYRNGYIHTLTNHHPRTKRASHILPNSPAIYYKVMEKVANNISAKDLLFGHIGTLIPGIGCLIFLYYHPNSYGLRISCTIVGGWYLVLTLLAYKYLPDRVFRPAPREYNTTSFLFKRIISSIFYIWKLRRIHIYLICLFLVQLTQASYKMMTITLTSSDSNTFQWCFLFLLSSLGSLLGLLIIPNIITNFNISTKKTLVSLHFLYMILPISLFLLFHFNYKQDHSNLSTTLTSMNNQFIAQHDLNIKDWPIYILCILEGFISGNLESLFRVHFLPFLPASREHEFFAHYHNYRTLANSISPVLILILLLISPSFKFSLFFPLPLLFISAVVLYFLNEEKAKLANMEFIKCTS